MGYSWSSIVLAHLVRQQPPTNHFGCDDVDRCFASSIVPTTATKFAQEGQHIWYSIVLAEQCRGPIWRRTLAESCGSVIQHGISTSSSLRIPAAVRGPVSVIYGQRDTRKSYTRRRSAAWVRARGTGANTVKVGKTDLQNGIFNPQSVIDLHSAMGSDASIALCGVKFISRLARHGIA